MFFLSFFFLFFFFLHLNLLAMRNQRPRKLTILDKILLEMWNYQAVIVISLIALVYFITGVVFSMLILDLSLMEAIYLTISTITSIGVTNIPYGSDDWVYTAVALYTMGSVVLIGVITLVIAEFVTAANITQEIDRSVNNSVKFDELKLLHQLGAHQGGIEDRMLSRNEFFVLTICRLRLLEYNDVRHIFHNFDRLDVSGSGLIPVYKVGSLGGRTGGSDPSGLDDNNSNTDSAAEDGSGGSGGHADGYFETNPNESTPLTGHI